ncbi:MAG TPA: hypothetical protein VN922_07620 [Bacteroidia bacterium]|nr:hypothetical protein [Bacteroidia bacterium]
MKYSAFTIHHLQFTILSRVFSLFGLLLSVNCFSQKLTATDINKMLQGKWQMESDTQHIIQFKADTMFFITANGSQPKVNEFYYISPHSCDSILYKSSSSFFLIEFDNAEDANKKVSFVGKICDKIKEISPTALVLLYHGNQEERFKRVK